jgi:hypothetical protein
MWADGGASKSHHAADCETCSRCDPLDDGLGRYHPRHRADSCPSIVDTIVQWIRFHACGIYLTDVDKGSHFAAWEEPQLFAEEIRAAFRSLRNSARRNGEQTVYAVFPATRGNLDWNST